MDQVLPHNNQLTSQISACSAKVHALTHPYFFSRRDWQASLVQHLSLLAFWPLWPLCLPSPVSHPSRYWQWVGGLSPHWIILLGLRVPSAKLPWNSTSLSWPWVVCAAIVWPLAMPSVPGWGAWLSAEVAPAASPGWPAAPFPVLSPDRHLLVSDLPVCCLYVLAGN